ncbi:hypothetical protein [Sinomicrobium weinanense]|uniref:Uncharacterized protein n=1 Tax=Sinomicrobium weinanense TaxID=2842200 RepID=A0A926JNY1_9FLAO|nr:hypothetical protein [Sinomicrobium weinanense]MBC9794792.1 hypothetical protein [Sinomicrobium weinanense]MBU3125051.1 hypothetical protein [Sinomicrobium weinanense]
MALSVIQFRGRDQGHYVFNADIGTARYFRYVLGSEAVKLKTGKNRKDTIQVVSGRKKASRLFEVNPALQKINRGEFPLKIPENEIDENTRYIQLYSFSGKKQKVPTISRIIKLYPPITKRVPEHKGHLWSGEQSKRMIKQVKMQDFTVTNKAFGHREPSMSKVMFWNTIVSRLPDIIANAAPIIGGLLKKDNGQSGPDNATQENRGGNSAQTEELIKSIVAILQSANGSEAATPRESEQNGVSESQSANGRGEGYNIEPDTLIGLGPVLEKILSPEAILAIGDDPQKLFKAIKDAVRKTEPNRPVTPPAIKTTPASKSMSYHLQPHSAIHRKNTYSKAKVAPALLAALPALMPLLQKVLNPETLKALNPAQLFKVVGDTVLKMDTRELEHLEKINPGIDTADDISKLLQGMSITPSHTSDEIKFKLIKNLNLDFIATKTVAFKNKNRVLYSKKGRVVIPFKISRASGQAVNRILKRSVVQITLKEAESLKEVFRKNIKLLDVDLGQPVSEAYLTPEEVKQLPCNSELKLEVAYIWKSAENKNIGVFKSHYVHFTDTYTFNRIGKKIGNPMPLNDIDIHRKFWHKVWEGGFSKSRRWEIDFDLKYFYVFDPKEEGISKLETRKRITDDNADPGEEHPGRRKVRARLKSGIDYGIGVLNSLLSLTGREIFDEELIRALKNSKLGGNLQDAARLRVEMKGREGDTGTLWAYPEIAFHTLHLSRPGEIDQYGQVVSLEPVEKIIPKPDAIHFIGTKSER